MKGMNMINPVSQAENLDIYLDFFFLTPYVPLVTKVCCFDLIITSFLFF